MKEAFDESNHETFYHLYQGIQKLVDESITNGFTPSEACIVLMMRTAIMFKKTYGHIGLWDKLTVGAMAEMISEMENVDDKELELPDTTE